MKKSLSFISCLFLLAVLLVAGTGIAGNMSVNIVGDNIEITGKGGVSRIAVNEDCINGSGIKKTELREVSAFKTVDIDGAFDVNIELNKPGRIEITGDDNILPHIITIVTKDGLFISSDKSICPKVPLIVNISNGDIESIDSDGANDITVSGMHNKHFALNVDGAGDIFASGVTGDFKVQMEGSGNLNAKDLHAEKVDISVKGSYDAIVYASKQLHASIDGVGDIVYYGNPDKVSEKISGVGEIERR